MTNNWFIRLFMSPTQHDLIQICQKLSEQGLQPSVGLLRSKANFPVSMPQVINVIRAWNNDPKALLAQIKSVPPQQDKNNQPETDLAARVTQLEQQVAALTQQLALLTASK